MKNNSNIGVNMYSVREHCKTLADLDTTLGRLKAIGYLNVQVSGFVHPWQQVRELLDKHGLACCATHDGLSGLLNDLPGVISKMRTLGCSFTALGHPGGEYFNPEASAKLPAMLDSIGAKLRAEGLRFGYHNHSGEFEKFGKSTMFDEIYSNTDPCNVMAELDTCWVQHGGASPEEWILKLKGRIEYVHLKDCTVFKGVFTMCEVGEGNLAWGPILRACRKSGVRMHIVEQDDPFNGRDIFESLGMSFRFLRKMGLK